MNFIASTMPKFPNSSTFRRGISKESEGDITAATITIDEDQGFGMSSSSLAPIENDTKEQHGTSTHEEIASTVRDRAEYIIGPIEVPLNDDKGCVHRNEREEQDDDSTGKQNHTIKIKKHTIYGANAKGSHPFFDGRFVEINGMVQINNDFEAHREITRQKLRRGRRRRPVLERSSVNA